MIQYRLIQWSPALLRCYRTRMLLDWTRLCQYLPVQGALLDVGCGVGSVDYEVASTNPGLRVLGIDIVPASIDLARRYHALPNIEFACRRLQDVGGRFDCILFVDVFHHVPPKEWTSLLGICSSLLCPGGYVLIKEIERRSRQISWLMDRYISRCPEVYLRNCEEMVEVVSRDLRVVSSEVRFRLPFGHYYIRAASR